MIKKFKLFLEAQQRLYKKTNPFSQGHRSPNLPYDKIMYDIDTLIMNNSGKIVAILEDKYKYDSTVLGNPFIKGNPQRKLFYIIAKKINLVLLMLEVSTKRIYKVLDTKSIKVDYDIVMGYGIKVKTDNILYVEFRKNRPVSVMYRTEGTMESDLDKKETYILSKQLADRLEIPIFLVNDTISNDIIYIKKKGEKDFIKIINTAESWKDAYKKMGI
jgi:hypothetical protein